MDNFSSESGKIMICGRWKVLGRLKHFRDGPLNILVLILTPCRPLFQDFSNFSIAEILKILPFLALYGHIVIVR